MLGFFNKLSVSSATIAIVAFLSSAAAAAPAPSDTMKVFDGAGNLVASASQDEASEIAGTIVVTPIAVDASQFGNATNLVEPSTGLFSDVFGICTCGQDGTLALGFASDTESTAVDFGTFPLHFIEGARAYDATQYLDAGLRAQGYTAWFTSDSVPEPASWAFMMLGLGGVGATLRRRSGVRAGV